MAEQKELTFEEILAVNLTLIPWQDRKEIEKIAKRLETIVGLYGDNGMMALGIVFNKLGKKI
jgi:hypothetical protein